MTYPIVETIVLVYVLEFVQMREGVAMTRGILRVSGAYVVAGFGGLWCVVLVVEVGLVVLEVSLDVDVDVDVEVTDVLFVLDDLLVVVVLVSTSTPPVGPGASKNDSDAADCAGVDVSIMRLLGAVVDEALLSSSAAPVGARMMLGRPSLGWTKGAVFWVRWAFTEDAMLLTAFGLTCGGGACGPGLLSAVGVAVMGVVKFRRVRRIVVSMEVVCMIADHVGGPLGSCNEISSGIRYGHQALMRTERLRFDATQ